MTATAGFRVHSDKRHEFSSLSFLDLYFRVHSARRSARREQIRISHFTVGERERLTSVVWNFFP